MNAGPFQDKNKLGCQLSTVQKDVMTKVNTPGKDGGVGEEDSRSMSKL